MKHLVKNSKIFFINITILDGNSPPNLQTPKLSSKLPKLASLKVNSFPYVSAPKKYEDIFSANLSFNQFYPGIVDLI